MATVAIIKLTQRMLTKRIIDANKSVLAFVKEHLPVSYDELNNGQKATYSEAIFDDGTKTELRIYRRPRGDELLSIKGIAKRAKVGDVVTLFADATNDVRISIKGEQHD